MTKGCPLINHYLDIFLFGSKIFIYWDGIYIYINIQSHIHIETSSEKGVELSPKRRERSTSISKGVSHAGEALREVLLGSTGDSFLASSFHYLFLLIFVQSFTAFICFSTLAKISLYFTPKILVFNSCSQVIPSHCIKCISVSS